MGGKSLIRWMVSGDGFLKAVGRFPLMGFTGRV